jgi:hypothetical protein
MAFDPGILVAIIVSVVCSIFVVYFFYIFGGFRHPPVAVVLMLLSAMIPVTMAVGLLPYDISLAFSTTTPNESLHMALEVLYWLSFTLTWVVVPLIVSFLRYNNSLSLKHRIWFTVRENLIVYGLILLAVGIGVGILLITHKADWDSLLPLAISLANGYGLIVLCLCLGHGFVQLPRQLWNMADPGNRYLFNLHVIARETRLTGKVIADTDAASVHCTAAKDRLRHSLLTQFESAGQWRANRLNQLKGEVPIPDRFFTAVTDNKDLTKFREMDWSTCSTFDLERFFSILDDIIDRLEEATNILKDSGRNALLALERYNKAGTATILPKLQKVFSIFLLLVNGVFVWGEICLIFTTPSWSLFNVLSHTSLSPLLKAVFVSTPVLGYLVLVGSWSLTHLRLGSFFRFTRGCTSANTLNYFAIILCRLGPTVSFHYLEQIEAERSELMAVMGAMKEIVFIGDKWNFYSPILLVLIMAFFAFKLPQYIAICCGKDPFTFDHSTMDYGDLATGEDILKELEPDARALIDSGLRYVRIVDAGLGRAPRTGSDSDMEAPLTDL